jgi:hypothetical protein
MGLAEGDVMTGDNMADQLIAPIDENREFPDAVARLGMSVGRLRE